MTYAIPGQMLRPALDAALERLEEQSKQGRCGVCSKEMSRLESYSGCAFFNQQTGEMTPWMCPECAKEHRKK